MPAFINPIFNALCDIARRDDRDSPEQRRHFHARLRERSIHQGELAIESPRVFHTPVSLLAFEGNADGVDFLLRHGANKNDAVEGYAQGGHFVQANALLKEGGDSLLAAKGYARGGYFIKANALLTEATKEISQKAAKVTFLKFAARRGVIIREDRNVAASKAVVVAKNRFLLLLKETFYCYAQSGFVDQVDALRAQYDNQIPISDRKNVDQRIIDGYGRGGHVELVNRKAHQINASAKDVTIISPGSTSTTSAWCFHVSNPLSEYASSGCDSKVDSQLRKYSEESCYVDSAIKAYAKSGLTERVNTLLNQHCPTSERLLSAIKSAIVGYAHNADIRHIEELLSRYQHDVSELTTQWFLQFIISLLDSHVKTHDKLLQIAAIINHPQLFDAIIDYGVNKKFAPKNELLKSVALLREPVELYEHDQACLIPFIPSAPVLKTFLLDHDLYAWSLAAIRLVNSGRMAYDVFFIIASYASQTCAAIAARQPGSNEDYYLGIIQQTHGYRMGLLANRMRHCASESPVSAHQKTVMLGWISDDHIRRSALSRAVVPSVSERKAIMEELAAAAENTARVARSP